MLVINDLKRLTLICSLGIATALFAADSASAISVANCQNRLNHMNKPDVCPPQNPAPRVGGRATNTCLDCAMAMRMASADCGYDVDDFGDFYPPEGDPYAPGSTCPKNWKKYSREKIVNLGSMVEFGGQVEVR